MNTMKKKISVIVPFYNSEAYLERSIRSICSQSISEQIELVLVDDGSYDGSKAVVLSTIQSCGFLGDVTYVRHEQNHGVAAARVTGIKNAHGEYILFCDSDDWQEPDICSKLLSASALCKADIVICNYRMDYGDHKVDVIGDYSGEYIKDLLLCRITGSLCNKLIRTTILQDNSFVYPKDDFCEDFVYSVQAGVKAKIISYIPDVLYNYVRRSESVTFRQDREKLIRISDQDYNNYCLVENILASENLLEKYAQERIYHKYIIKNSIRNCLNDYPDLINRWRETFPEINYEVLRCKYISWRMKCTYFLTLFGMWGGVLKIKRIISCIK